MPANLLPQSLCMIPRNDLHCYRSNLGFSTSIPRRSPALNLLQISNSRISLNLLSLSSNIHNGKLRSGSIVLRAEPGSEAVDVEEASEVDDDEAPKAEADAEVEEKPPRKQCVKLGDIMGILNKRAVETSDMQRPIPDLRTGDIVQIKMEFPENSFVKKKYVTQAEKRKQKDKEKAKKPRFSVYKGIVMSKQNAGIHTTIRIRRIIAGVGVEIVFPVYSPSIKEIKVVSHRKVRRARLYYLRDKLPRFSTFK